MLLFFGDPETKGAAEDARACLEMAVEMQTRLAELNNEWRRRGIEQPFRARMGINTGYCNVGNFGSEDRMDYTIIGAEANLAARLQSIAEPGGIVMSYETYALVREVVRAHPLDPITMKGISREVVPYSVDGLLQDLRQRKHVISEHATGVELFLDLDVIEPAAAARTRRLLENALAAIEREDQAAGAGVAPRSGSAFLQREPGAERDKGGGEGAPHPGHHSGPRDPGARASPRRTDHRWQRPRRSSP